MGGSLHTGGSVSMETHRRRMEKKKGRLVTYAEVFEDKHMKKKKDGTREWVEPRVARTYEAYQKRFEEWSQSQPDTEDGSSIQVTLNDVASIWTQVVGGAKKGRTYGLGSQHSVVVLRHCCLVMLVIRSITKRWKHYEKKMKS